VLRVVVTDDRGAQDSAEVSVAPNTSSTTAPANAVLGVCPTATPPNPTPTPNPTPNPTPTPTPTPAPSPADSGGGGGGALDGWFVLSLLVLLAARQRRIRVARADLS
jgi:hypothetical protein